MNQETANIIRDAKLQRAAMIRSFFVRLFQRKAPLGHLKHS